MKLFFKKKKLRIMKNIYIICWVLFIHYHSPLAKTHVNGIMLCSVCISILEHTVPLIITQA